MQAQKCDYCSQGRTELTCLLKLYSWYCIIIFLSVLGNAPSHTQAWLLHLGETVEKTKASGAGKSEDAVTGQKYSQCDFYWCPFSYNSLAEYFIPRCLHVLYYPSTHLSELNLALIMDTGNPLLLLSLCYNF